LIPPEYEMMPFLLQIRGSTSVNVENIFDQIIKQVYQGSKWKSKTFLKTTRSLIYVKAIYL
jgi:hypothetical protein